MSIFGTATNVQALTSNIATALGIDSWELQNASYNGCSFLIFQQLPVVQGSQLYKAEEDIIAQVNQGLTPNANSDPNARGQLVATTLGSMTIEDELMCGIVIKSNPYANRIDTEDTGFEGYRFKFNVVFVGHDYQKAYYNFENVVKNPPNNTNFKKLIHPTRGVINGITQCMSLKKIIDLTHWRGCVAEIVFRTEETNISTSQALTSRTQQIVNALQSSLGVATALGATLFNVTNVQISNPLSSTTRKIKAFNPTTTIFNPLNFSTYTVINSQLTLLSNILTNSINYIYQKSNTGIAIPALDSQTIDYSFLPSSINQNIAFTIAQVPVIVQYYSNQCTIATNIINNYGLGISTNQVINQINNSLSSLVSLVYTIKTTSQYNTYTLPFTMSIRRVLANNKLSLSLLPTILSINQQLLSSNSIPIGTIVNLP